MNATTWLHLWFDPDICRQLGTALFHFLWQATLLWLVCLCLHSVLRNRSSELRYVLNVALLIMMALCVPVQLLVIRSEPERSSAVSHSAEHISLDGSDSMDSRNRQKARQSGNVTGTFSSSPTVVSQAIPVMVSISDQDSTVAYHDDSLEGWNTAATWVVAGWVLGVVVMLLRLLVAVAAGWRLARLTRPVRESFLLQAATVQAVRLGLAVSPTIAWCERVSVPLVTGILRPVVLLPPAILTGMDPVQVEALLAHEFAHIRRLDPLLNFLQRMIEATFFFHPAVWYVSAQVHRERENCCDDLVIKVGMPRLRYADALVRMAEICAWERFPTASVAATGHSGSDLKRRVLRLLVPEPTGRPGSAMIVVGVLAVVATLAHAAVRMAAEHPIESAEPAAGLPEGIVAVLGEDRARIWGHPKQLLLTSDRQRLFVTEENGHVSIFDAATLHRVFQFRPHELRCLDIALLDSDRRLLTISIDGSVRLWDVTTATPERLSSFEAFDGTDAAGWLTMSVAGLAQRVAVRSDSQITLLEVKDDKLRHVADLPTRVDYTPFNYAISPDGRWLVACEDQKTSETITNPNGGMYGYRDAVLAVWDLRGKVPQVVSELNLKTVDQLTFSPDGHFLFGVDPYFLPERVASTWAFDEGHLVASSSLPVVPGPQASFAFNEQGTRMAFRREGGDLAILQKADGAWVSQIQLSAGRHGSVVFQGDDSLVVANPPELVRWDFIDGQYRRQRSPDGHRSIVNGLQFDPQTDSLLSAGEDCVREWSLTDIERHGEPSREHDFTHVSGMWPWGGQKGVVLKRTIQGACVIEGVRRSNGKMLARFRVDCGSNYRDAAWCAAMHPTQDLLVTGHWDRKIRLWSTRTFTPRKISEWTAHAGHVCGLSFSPDGSQLASVGWDHTTCVWTFADFNADTLPQRRVMGKHEDIVRSVAWSTDGRMLASGGQDGQILLWDLTDDADEVSLVQPEDGKGKKDNYDVKTVGSLQFSQDGRQLLSGDGKGRVTVWSLPDRTIRNRWQMSGWVWDAKFSPDESLIATANSDGTIYLLKNSVAQ